MQIKMMRTDALRESPENPRLIDGEAVAAVARSISEFGFKVPCVVDRGGELVAGHARLRAAKELGMEQVPCVVADDLTPEQVQAVSASWRTGRTTWPDSGTWTRWRLLVPQMPDVADWFADVDLYVPDAEGLPVPSFSGEDAPGSEPAPSEGQTPTEPAGEPHGAFSPPDVDPDPVVFLAVRVRRTRYAETKARIEECLGRGVSEPDGPAVTPGPDGMQD